MTGHSEALNTDERLYRSASHLCSGFDVQICTPTPQISAEGGAKLSLLDVGQQSWCGQSTG